MSDQDFFFDEEDGAKPAAKTSAKATAAAKTQSSNRPATLARASFFEQSVSMSIAALMAVIALLVGVIVGFVIPTGGATPPVTATAPAATEAAPQLTEDQLSSGDLPAGHPDLSGMTASSSAGATGSATTTGN